MEGRFLKRLSMAYALFLLLIVASAGYAESRLTASEPFSLPISTVILDPGHGGYDPGAVSSWSFAPDGVIQEKWVNLEIANLVRDILQASDPSLKIVMTRTADTFLSLEQRALIGQQTDPGQGHTAILVSIHVNSSTSLEPSGFELLVKSTKKQVRFLNDSSPDWHIARYALFTNTELNRLLNRENLLFSQLVESALVSAFPLVGSRGVKEQDVWVLNACNIPAVLVETAFISHEEDARQMLSATWRQQMAQAIANGVVSFIHTTR